MTKDLSIKSPMSKSTNGHQMVISVSFNNHTHSFPVISGRVKTYNMMGDLQYTLQQSVLETLSKSYKQRLTKPTANLISVSSGTSVNYVAVALQFPSMQPMVIDFNWLRANVPSVKVQTPYWREPVPVSTTVDMTGVSEEPFLREKMANCPPNFVSESDEDNIDPSPPSKKRKASRKQELLPRPGADMQIEQQEITTQPPVTKGKAKTTAPVRGRLRRPLLLLTRPRPPPQDEPPLSPILTEGEMDVVSEAITEGTLGATETLLGKPWKLQIYICQRAFSEGPPWTTRTICY